MHVVVCSYHRSPERAARYVSYMSHREERLPGGETRPLHTFGQRYDALTRAAYSPRGLEHSIRDRLIQDGHIGSRRPAYFRAVLTCNDEAAAKLRALPRPIAEQRMRAAFQGALRSTRVTRQLEGVYALHWHGGAGRPAHPHLHAICSPVAADGRPVYLHRRAIERMREAWGRELARSLRLTPTRERTLLPERARAPLRTRDHIPTRGGPDRDETRPERRRAQSAPILNAVSHAQRALAYARNPIRTAAHDATRAAVRSLIQAATRPGPTRTVAHTMATAVLNGPRSAVMSVATKAAGPVATPASIALAIGRATLALVRTAAREI